MAVGRVQPIWGERRTAPWRYAGTYERLLAFAGLSAVVATGLVVASIDSVELSDLSNGGSNAASTPDGSAGRTTGARREIMAGGYGGVSYTHPSAVEFKNPGKTDLKVEGFGWLGKPFKSPIYYGLRAISWESMSPFGAMLDFTHAKAIANPDDTATLTGTHNGRQLPAKARIGDTFRHLEFSHGHNLVTLNGLARIGLLARLRPYVGAGAGVTLPHTEIGFLGENARTYTYQFAGFAGQVLAGVEIPLGRTSVFVEYKFTYAPYDVPLSHEPYGWLLFTDVWQQLTEALSGNPPPGGRARTTLASHHGIGGVLVRVNQGSQAPR